MQEEKYGSRDRTYSAWHRRLSTQRFVGIEAAQTLAMIDLDAALYVEYDDGTKEPLALIETAADVGQEFKTATVTKKLAARANLPAYVLLYSKSSTRNPADHEWFDIQSFRAKQLTPVMELSWKIYTPAEWAAKLKELRTAEAKRLDQLIARTVAAEKVTPALSGAIPYVDNANKPTAEELREQLASLWKTHLDRDRPMPQSLGRTKPTDLF